MESDVLRRTRIILISVAGIVLLLAVRTVFAFVRYSQVERGFASVHVGESRAAVINDDRKAELPRG